MPVDVAIIGAGPAGLAAAIQLQRFGLSPLIFEKDRPGGLLHNANLVENYPGFPHGIPGPQLVELIVTQAELTGVRITFEEVLDLSSPGDRFQIRTTGGDYQARIAVVASGTAPLAAGDLHIPANLSSRFFYEVSPLLSLQSKRIAIIGAGDAAFDYALNLGRSNTVHILNRSQQRRCLPLLWERASASPHIRYHQDTSVLEVRQHPSVGMSLACHSPAGDFKLKVDYLIAALGRTPQTGFISSSIEAQRASLVNQGLLHFIGDVKNGSFRQTSIAVGDGVLAAMQIYQYLQENHK